jgi:signal transduction histidine kinase/CheY-like chemotaxis protein
MPGGLKENIEYVMGRKLHIAKAEGYNVYEKLDKYVETPENFLPEIFDVLNCSEGCNIGSACSHDRNVFEIEKRMDNKRRRAKALYENEYYESLYKTYDKTFNIDHFIREYHPVSTTSVQITDADIEKAFELLGKTDYEKQNIDCGACGSETCHNMARKIALNVNIPINCIVKSMEDARIEHEDNLLAHKQLADTESQKIEAEAANKAKSSFLRTMSHEIRTPLNAILGITEIQLQNNTLDQNVREGLEKIYTSGDLLLGIINDILDLSKIEAGKMELIIAKYEIASFISDTVQLNVIQIGSKPIEFDLCVDENIPSVLLGDELRIKQILNNLLSNAVKYSSSGTVKLSILAESCDGDENKVILVITVSDSGQGMTKEQVSKLFDGYFRFNMKANRTTKGTGLGMSITRNIVNLMNGELSIESEPGKGSVFTVRLPQGKSGTEVLGREMAENLNQFRTTNRAQMKRVQIIREPMPYGSVLIVDDVETNIYVARGLLSPYQLKIDSADSGAAAINKIKNGKTYDIIFMDHMMPEMDGIKTTKIIRGMEYSKPIVALTANAVAGQADVFLKNGFDDYITKPIDVRQLNAVLNKLIRDIQPPEVIEAAKKNAHNEQPGNEIQHGISPYLAEVFTRDALKTIAALEALSKKNDYTNEDDLRTYTINVHGIKNALANVGKINLSATAIKLEKAGREKKIELIQSETPDFINALQAVVKELKPIMETAAVGNEDEDKPYLKEMLHTIIMACAEYDQNTVDNTLIEFRKKAWSPQTNELLSTIAEQLLHSDFDEIADDINKFLGI